ncbi:MAG: prolyl oligopeptidase family serine peptidase [Parachlamydia sp.]|nr:prolyl oligopeptidase family serine peptidase [Parachlamydia sp.]
MKIKFMITCLCFASFTFSSSIAEIPVSLVRDTKEIDSYHPPQASPDGRYLAWVIREKPELDYFDPMDWCNPAQIHYYVKGTKICIGGENLEQPIVIGVKGKSCWNPSWSPDSKNIAYYSDAACVGELWIYNLTQRKSRKVASLPLRCGVSSQKPVWSKNSQEIFVRQIPDQIFAKYKTYLSQTVSSYQNEKASWKDLNELREASDLVAVNVKKGDARLVLAADSDQALDCVEQSPSGKWLSYVTKKWDGSQVHGWIFDIGVVSADGGNYQLLSQSNLLSCSYLEAIGISIWHPELDHLYFIANQQLYDARYSESALISCEPVHPDLGKLDPATLAITQDGKGLIVGQEIIDTHDYSRPHATRLVYIPLDKSDSKVFNLPEEWAFSTLIQNRNCRAWQPDVKTICYLATNKEKGRALIRLSLDSGEFQVIWQGQGKLVPRDFQNNQKLFCSYEDFNNPKEIYLYDNHMSCLKQISNTEPAFDQWDIGSVKLLETVVPGTRGVEKVQTALILPPGYTPGEKYPAIVVQYPGSDVSKMIAYFGGGDCIGGLPNWLLSSRNFIVLLPDLVMGDEAIGNPLQVMTDRLIPQIVQAAEEGFIDLNRVGIMGQSYGGYGAVGIISHTQLFRAAVATNGLYDLASFTHLLDEDGQNFWMSWAELSQGRMGKYLYDDPKRYLDNSPFYRADQIHTPLLLIHGKWDEAYQDATKLFSALRRLKRPVELAAYHKGHHIIGSMQRKDHLDAVSRILDFFEQNLK